MMNTTNPQPQQKLQVAICDMQPIVSEGLRSLLANREDLEFADATDTLEGALQNQLARTGLRNPDVLLVDKSFGTQSVLDFLNQLRALQTGTNSVVWGLSMTEAEALRFLQAGARGILRKSADMAAVLACLRTVGTGRNWMQDSVFRDFLRHDRHGRSDLTMREQQVLELVEQGYKNKEIASHLGIQPGTVKIHLKHIFEKTGVRGRYGLALTGLRDRGGLSMTAA
jgi:two-component system, NarL family, nitrate/nitrite response regulator NarL